MKRLENFTMKEVTDYIIEDIVKERVITKSLARKLLINALLYNVVIDEINNQIDFLINFE